MSAISSSNNSTTDRGPSRPTISVSSSRSLSMFYYVCSHQRFHDKHDSNISSSVCAREIYCMPHEKCDDDDVVVDGGCDGTQQTKQVQTDATIVGSCEHK